jgi:glycosyltransferase involved in cell wall biosynthesis
MAKELTRLGHVVHLFAGDNKYDLLPEYPVFDGGHYDLALVNHNVCLGALEGTDIDMKIFTSHGIIPHLEQPWLGADRYVAVSEEVRDNLLKQGFPSTIIRNPIDLEMYRSERPTSEKLTNVLFMSNYQGEAREVIENACKGLNLRIFGKDSQGGVQTQNVVEEMNWADVVIGLGRTAYEAMACERNVIVYDYNGADGFVTPQSVLEFRKNNCSGRAYKVKYSAGDLKAILGLYDPSMGTKLREYVKENNNVQKVVQQYLALCNTKS